MSELTEVLRLLVPDPERLDKGKARMSAVWEGAATDRTPIVLQGAELPERQRLPRYDLYEQFYDRERMLIEHVWGMIGIARAGGDAQLTMRANLGTGFVASVFGLEQRIFHDKMPWLVDHLTKEEILSFEFPEDVSQAPTVARALDYVGFFRDVLDGRAHVSLSDTQGPFDIAHLVYGNTIFTEFFDDPQFVHHLMGLATRAYVEVTKAMKLAVGEGECEGYHSAMYMSCGGVRCCEDTSTLLPPDLFEEFALPYVRKGLAPFGGGWVHFCGGGGHLLDAYLAAPEVRGINFGNPEKFDYEETIDRITTAGKFYYGPFPVLEGEDVPAYFKRILLPLSDRQTGLIFSPDGQVYLEIPDRREVEKVWDRVHQELAW